MGVNYYVHGAQCLACGHVDTRLHIGKKSVGWCFALRVHPFLDIHDLTDWVVFWDGTAREIVDAYGRRVSAAEMYRIIAEPPACAPLAQYIRRVDWTADWYRENEAVPGPRGLARHRISTDTSAPTRCVGHGVGAWDIFVGNFS